MKFGIDYDKVFEIGQFVKEKSEEINTIYYEIIDLCKKINDNWQSEDSSVYLEHMIAYTKNKIKDNEVLAKTGTTLCKVSSIYNEQDNKWAKNLVKDVELRKGKI